MLTIAALALLAPASASQRPVTRPPISQKPKVGKILVQPLDKGVESEGRDVTIAWLRVNDPAFVAGVLEGSGTGRGAQLARMVVPVRLQGQMTSARMLSRGAAGTPPRPVGNQPAPPRSAGPGGSSRVIVGAPMRYVRFSGLFPTSAIPLRREDLNLGTVEEGSRTTRRQYQGTALADGTLEIKAPRDGAINVTKVTTWSGLLTLTSARGLAQRAAERELPVTRETTSVPIRAGQDYTVTVEMKAAKRGAQTKTIQISDGGKVALKAAGTVAFHSRGSTQFWIEGSDWTVAPGSRIQTYLHVTTDGNAPTRVSVRDADADVNSGRGVRFFATEKNAPAKGEVVIPITIDVPLQAANDNVPVRMEVSAFDGSAVGTIGLDVGIETKWRVFDNVKLDAGNVHVTSTFRYSNSGYWSLTSNSERSGILISNDVWGGVIIQHPIANGKNLGINGIGSSNGWDPRLTEVYGSRVRLYLTNNKDRWDQFWNGNAGTPLSR